MHTGYTASFGIPTVSKPMAGTSSVKPGKALDELQAHRALSEIYCAILID